MNMNPQLMKLVGLMGRLAFRLTTAEEMPPEERVALQGYIEFINALNKANLQDPEEYPWRDQQDGYSKTIRKLIGHFPMVTPVATAVVLDNDMRVLLERRSDNGKWSLPSGIIEPGETAKTGVVRELHEEAGLMVDEEDLRLFDEFSGKQHIYPHGDIIWSVKLIYIVKRFWGEPKPNFESTELQWFGLGELPENASGSTRSIAKAILARFSEVESW